MSKKSTIEKSVEESEEKIKDFADLLDSLNNTEDKKKLLWKEAYKNAIDDRLNASILLNDLILNINGSMGNHATHGILASKYMECMSKANSQILKLAELIAKEQEKEEQVSPDEMYAMIRENS